MCVFSPHFADCGSLADVTHDFLSCMYSGIVPEDPIPILSTQPSPTQDMRYAS